MKILLFTLIFFAGASPAFGHETTTAKAATTAEKAAPASTRWQADAPLQAGMARVLVASKALEHMQHGHLNPAQVTALADEIKGAVNDMFAQCKLDPAPDAALHPLLARLLTASEALRTNPMESSPVEDIHAVLARYGELFKEDRA